MVPAGTLKVPSWLEAAVPPLSVPYLAVTVRACAVSFAFTVSLPSAIE